MPEETTNVPSRDEQLDMVARDLASRHQAFAAWRGRFNDLGKAILEDRGSGSAAAKWWNDEASGQLFILLRLMAGYRSKELEHAVRELERALGIPGFLLKGEEVPDSKTENWTLVVKNPERFFALGRWFAGCFSKEFPIGYRLDSDEPTPPLLSQLFEVCPGLEERLRSSRITACPQADVNDAIREMRQEERSFEWLNAPIRGSVYTLRLEEASRGLSMGLMMKGDPGEVIQSLRSGDRDDLATWLFKLPGLARPKWRGDVHFFLESVRDEWLRHRPSLVSRSVQCGYGAAFDPEKWWDEFEVSTEGQFTATVVDLD